MVRTKNTLRASPNKKTDLKTIKKNYKQKARVSARSRRTSRATLINSHRLTLKQRTVIYYLLSKKQFSLTSEDAIIFFHHIFPNKEDLTAKNIHDDWTRRNSKTNGSTMYNMRICKSKNNFTREEILAHEYALSQIEQACDHFDIAYDFDFVVDLGSPTDGVFLHPSPSLSRLPRGILNGRTLPLGYQQMPADWVDPTVQWYRDEARLHRKVRVYGDMHTRSKLNEVVARTPSVTPAPAPAAPVARASATPSQASVRGSPTAGLQTIDEEDNEDEQDEGESQDEQERQDEHGEQDEEENQVEEGGLSEEEEVEDNGDGEEEDDEQPDQVNDQAGKTVHEDELVNEQTQEQHDDFQMIDRELDQDDVITIVSEDVGRLSIHGNDLQRVHRRTQRMGRSFKREPRTQAILDAISALPAAKKMDFFKAAFPTLKDDDAAQLNLNTHAEIEAAWYRLRTDEHQSTFQFLDALTSSDSPLCSSYAPRLLMFHRFFLQAHWNGLSYNRPAPFSAIPVLDSLYKRGGQVLRAFVPGTNSYEDIMACNDAFCGYCAGPSYVPPTEDPAQDTGNLPFVHSSGLDYGSATMIDGVTEGVQFQDDGMGDLGSVLPAGARFPALMNITFADGLQRAVFICNLAH